MDILLQGSPASNAFRLFGLSVIAAIVAWTCVVGFWRHVVLAMMVDGPKVIDTDRRTTAREASYREDDRVFHNWLDNTGRDGIPAGWANRESVFGDGPPWRDIDPEDGPVVHEPSTKFWGWGNPLAPRTRRPDPRPVDLAGVPTGPAYYPVGPHNIPGVAYDRDGRAIGAAPVGGAWARRPRAVVVPCGPRSGETVRVIGQSQHYPGTWFVEAAGGRVAVLEGDWLGEG